MGPGLSECLASSMLFRDFGGSWEDGVTDMEPDAGMPPVTEPYLAVEAWVKGTYPRRWDKGVQHIDRRDSEPFARPHSASLLGWSSMLLTVD